MKIISTLFFAFIILVSTYFIVGLGTIIKNGTSITNKPGTITRLKLFFSTNTAKTDEASSFPELKPQRYTLQKTEINILFEKIILAAESLGYEFIKNKSDERTLHFTITTPLFKFVDDLTINIDIENNEAVVNALSQSRSGRADFGANIANIRNFFAILDDKLP